MMQKQNTQKGFSIGEVLISAFVLLVGVVGAMVLIINNLTATHDARDTIIAAQLAQEGVELVRNLRDNYVALGQDDIGEDTFNPLYHLEGMNGLDCIVDHDDVINASNIDAAVVSCGASYGLNHDGTFFVHPPGGESTEFSRKIRVVYNDGGTSGDFTDDYAAIHSFVRWGGENINGRDSQNNLVADPDDLAQCATIDKCAVASTIVTSWVGHD
jgi:Tfp pilus assembly protein PilV